MFKAKSFKKLGILLISFISIISMAKIQVNAIRYVDGRFITNAVFMRTIIEKTSFMIKNCIEPETIFSKKLLQAIKNKMNPLPKMPFVIISNNDVVENIVLIVPSTASKETVTASLSPRNPSMSVGEVAKLLCDSNDDIMNLFKFDGLAKLEEGRSDIMDYASPRIHRVQQHTDPLNEKQMKQIKKQIEQMEQMKKQMEQTMEQMEPMTSPEIDYTLLAIHNQTPCKLVDNKGEPIYIFINVISDWRDI